MFRNPKSKHPLYEIPYKNYHHFSLNMIKVKLGIRHPCHIVLVVSYPMC